MKPELKKEIFRINKNYLFKDERRQLPIKLHINYTLGYLSHEASKSLGELSGVRT